MSDFIYISIPRTGTNSIHKVIGQVPDENHMSIRKIDRGGMSFAFVRNPYDLLVSWFMYHKKFQQNHKEYHCTFKEWVMDGCPTHWLQGFCDYKGITHPLNQWEYVCDWDGKIIVNFVGRYEKLSIHFNAVMHKMGRDEVDLPFINGVKKGHYAQYYDEQIKDKVYSMFKKDFELFNYKKEDV